MRRLSSRLTSGFWGAPRGSGKKAGFWPEPSAPETMTMTAKPGVRNSEWKPILKSRRNDMALPLSLVPGAHAGNRNSALSLPIATCRVYGSYWLMIGEVCPLSGWIVANPDTLAGSNIDSDDVGRGDG